MIIYTPGMFIPDKWENSELKQIHIKLPESLHRELRIQAAIKGQTLQDYVVKALEGKINSDKATYSLTDPAKESISSDTTE
jgi:hypothetical protein